ncbi:MAG: hypothetical protein K2Y31_00910 [Burkholderiales bacterium]|jgi:tetratricopeptide (TPR) repeat protein|nr:hypothetical protein [Burkholderiales bacterium]
MQLLNRRIVFFLFMLVMAVTAHAQSPREQLNQLVTQLLATPGDTALRERIIKLAQEIKPPPAVPEEAERRMARGIAGFQGAKSPTDYQIAGREFQGAVDAAPWLADAYFNLGMALDKAGDHIAAIRSLKLALAANPESREVRNLLYQVEFRAEQAASERAKKEREAREAVRTIAGEWADVSGGNMNFVIQQVSGRYDVRWSNQALAYRVHSVSDQQFSYQLDQGLQQVYTTCTLSSDGQGLTCQARYVQSGGASGNFDPRRYRRLR